MGEIIMRNWDLREFRVRVNVPFLIQQVRLPIWWVKIPIRGLLNPIKQVIPLTSRIQYHAHLYPPSLFLVHNSTIIAELKVKSSLSISPCHDHELTPSTAHTEYSTHRVQHTPWIVCLPFILTITS